MKILSKMLCFLLILAVVPTVLCMPMTAAAKGTDEEAFNKLYAFGILEKGDDLRYEDEISRGTFLRYAARLLGDFPKVTGENPFSDVTAETDCYEEVTAFKSLGYISGETGSKFRPDDAITKAEASKILMAVLGYGEAAAKRLSYPAGYISFAERLKLFDGVKQAQTFDAQDMAMLLLNTLKTPLLGVESMLEYDENYYVRYSDDKEETLLGQNFSIYPTEGLFETNAYTSIYGESKVAHGYASVGGKVYKANVKLAVSLLGYYVEGYYKDNDNAPNELIYVHEKEGKNQTVTVKGKDIYRESIKENGFTYYDEENGANEDVETERAVVMLYNGVVVAYNKSYLTKDLAYVTLIDNDKDDKFEIISVMEYRSIVVQSIGRDYTVADELGGTNVELDPNSNEYDLFLENAEGEISVTEISAGDVLSYAVPIGTKPPVKFVYVSNKSATGTITGKDEDGIYLDGVLYETEKDCLEKSIIGNKGTFLIDYFNRVVHKTVERDVVFGYLNSIEKKNFSVRAKIFTENSRFVELEFKESFHLNDKKTDAMDFYKDYGADTDLYRKLVTYTVNDDAEIVSMNFAETSEEWTDGELEMINHDKFRLSAYEDKAQYRSGMTSFGNNILLTAQTKIFMVPLQARNAVGELDKFYVTTRDTMVQDREYSNIYAYNSDELHRAEVCVLIGNEMSVDTTSKLLLVEEIAQSVKDDGTETYSIRGMYMGANMSIQTKDKATVTSVSGGVSGGDVIQMVYDNDGYVVKINMIYKYSKTAEPQFINGALYASPTFLGGKVKRYNTEAKRIAINYGTNNVGIFMTDALSNTYLYNTKTGKVERITAEEIHPDDLVVVQIRYFNIYQMIVYRS